jgi:hypothetical protein
MKHTYRCLSKKILPAIFLTVMAITAGAQNVGIGIANPGNKLEVIGNLVIKSETVAAKNAPTASQTFNLINGTTVNVPYADSVARIYDPGGPSGNYVANLNASSAVLPNTAVYGYELEFDHVQLGTGDSLIITGFSGNRLMAVGNNYSTTGTYTFQSAGMIILFKSNADASVGTGFSLLVKKIYLDQSAPSVTALSQVGNSLSFDVKNGSLRAGTGNTGTIGNLSTAFGKDNLAEGLYAIAMGYNNISKGQSSVTTGENNNADGFRNILSGTDNYYQGNNGIVLGSQNSGSGSSSIILGSSNTATNDVYSFIAGSGNTTAGSYQSALIGTGLSAPASYSTVLGIYNKVPATIYDQYNWDGRDPLLTLGNGYLGPSNALMILKNGNTGIGIDAPSAPLHVKEKMILDQPAATGLASIEWRSNNSYRGGLGYDQSAGRFFFFEGESGQNVFFINNGRFGIRRDATTNALEVGGEASKSTAGSWLGNSDARLKKNIYPVTNALDKLLQLRGVQYEWNDHQTGYPRPQGIQLGFTAQNVQEVFPEKVSTDAQGFLQTAYGTYDPLIVEAIRELTKKVEELEQKIKLLQEK